ncbi:hypothetical protein V8E36_004734 [Tilletia maclaganii]
MPGPVPPYRSGSTTNFYAGSNLNRFSWLRNSSDFINGAVTSTSARFILLNNLNPLVYKSAAGGDGDGRAVGQQKKERAGQLATLSWDEVKDAVLESIQIARGDGPGADASASGASAAKEQARVFGPDVLGLQAPTISESVSSSKPNENQDLEAVQKQFAKATESIGPPNLVLVFLGVDESGTSAAPSVPGQVATDAAAAAAAAAGGGGGGGEVREGKELEGVPYFALSVSYAPHSNQHFGQHHHHHHTGNSSDPSGQAQQGQLPVHKLREDLLARGEYEFVDTRSLAQAASWPAHHAAMLAQARSLVDWNERQAYCPACSRRQYSLWSGHKRSCSSVLAASNPTTKVLQPFLPETASPTSASTSFESDGRVWPCPATKTLSNFSYPRTDSVVIMGVLNRTGDKILLGRQKTWPKSMYSCLAGFLEAGESLEEAVKREIYEEAALEIEDVVYHSSQPWPFPANLMIGCFGICKSENPESEVRLDLDNELEDARFFTREEVLEVIEASANRIMTKRDLRRYEEGQNRNVIKPASGDGAAGKLDEKGQWRAGDQSAGSESDGEGEKPKWNKKDEGSVANVRSGGVPSNKSFGIPASTAIAHVLIASWARGEAYIPNLPQSARM